MWDLGSAEAAEMAKLAETTYRDVNIGLANQFALFAEKVGIDVHQVIEASNSQPYSHIHQPGIAVGGHCIPVYPRLYLSGDPDATVVRAAREANAAMPAHVVGRLAERLGDLAGLRVAVLGAAYRGGVKETAFSGVFDTVRALRGPGRRADRARPDVLRRRARARWASQPYHLGERGRRGRRPVRPRASTPTCAPDDIPGARLVLNGRPGLRLDLGGEPEVVVVGTGTVDRPAAD